MASTPSVRHFSACLRCVRQLPGANGTRRLLSTSSAAREELQTQPVNATGPPPPSNPPEGAAQKASPQEVPEYMQKWGTLDPQMVENKKQERRLLRREHVQPVGSRRRRAALRRSAIQQATEIPFEQLPYQCFQEARKVLLEDRQEKIKEIETQQQRIKNLMDQDPSVSGGPAAKETRLRSMRKHLNDLIILADINDPVVKRKFEDGQGDMNKPIYRYLADKKWRQYKRLVLEQRITQMALIPDVLPSLDLVADIDLGFGRKTVAPGDFVDSSISEKLPRINVQTFTPGEKLVTVVVVDADVPVPETDSFTYRCHLIASNISISPSNTSIPLQRIAQEDQKVEDPSAKKIALPWIAPWAHRGAPYHRLGIFVFEQNAGQALDITKLSQTKRMGFNLRSFSDSNKLKPITATLFRTKWDDSMAGVMERAGLKSQLNVEFKRKKVEPLPYKRRTELRLRQHHFCATLPIPSSPSTHPSIFTIASLQQPLMIPNSPIVPSPFLPSQQQIALAIAIVRSKPPGVPLRDHVAQLRSKTKRGRDPLDTVNPGCYIDQVAYWKERCKRAEDECDNLRNANIKLERSNQLLLRQIDTVVDLDASVNARPLSPKKSLKRPRSTQKRGQDPVADAQEAIDHDLDFLEAMGKDGNALMQSLFNVHSSCRATDPDPNILCFNLISSASATGKVTLFAAQNHEALSRQGHKNTSGATALEKDRSDFANALSVCARAFMSILVGADKLMKLEPDKRLASLVVCELADMFKTALKAIEISAQFTAQSFQSQPRAPKKTKTKASLDVVKESGAAKSVAHLLISFVGLLEKNDDFHQKIFEGFAFMLFERVGKRLYYSTFGQHRSSSIEENIMPIPEARGSVETFKRNCDALGMRLEAKALILVLERVMGLAPNHMNPQSLRANQTPNRASRAMSIRTITTSSRARLSQLAKDRLQRTLLACLYGGKTDDEFLDVLTKPMPQMRLGQMQNVVKIEDEDVETWYKEEVWRLVGWDILAREGGW
ncbi:phosphatidylethanolamine-binding protein pebp [Curvularia clavata]|uniref:Large ribosomal subunit protein mL38 n=1 Tax=Curvularia clavata TaxID=95742 RepID=A0A9Q8Z7Z3_CURCL|nr:phosphatidylethanolamine-binding protein pebp [Curvularia clavata]